MEIERKWLLSTVPSADKYYKYNVQQSYLSTGTPEVRFTCKQPLSSPLDPGPVERTTPKLTIKGPGTLSRQEFEVIIGLDQYRTLCEMVDEQPIHKTYYVFPLDGDLRLEVSIVDQSWIYAEVEFSSEEEARSFEFPFSECEPREVTEDPSYKMKNYWDRTRKTESEDKPMTLDEMYQELETVDDGWLWCVDLSKDHQNGWYKNANLRKWSNIAAYGKTWLAYRNIPR